MRQPTYRILAKNHFISNDTWETGLNNNDIIIGPSGSGKTRGYVMPNILQCNESMIIVGPKGRLQKEMTEILRTNGYKIRNIDFMDCGNSDGYNPLSYIRYNHKKESYNVQDMKTIATCIVPCEDKVQPFWEMAARMYLESMIAYVMECLPVAEHNLDSIIALFTEMGTGKFDRLYMELNQLNPGSFAAMQYNMYKSTARAGKMYESIRGILAEKLSMIAFGGASEMFHQLKQIHFADLGREKTALFVTVSDTDRSMDKLANLFFTQAIHTLCSSADREYENGKLKIPVRLLLDDFATNVYISDFDKITSMIRSREIYVSIILHYISQLQSLYGYADATTILNNADNLLYLGGQEVETARLIGIKANKSTSSILNMPLSKAWLFTRGQSPVEAEEFELEAHEKYKKLPEYIEKVSSFV